MNGESMSGALAAAGASRAGDALGAVRALMAERRYDALIVPRADEHLGEYLPPHNERLRWLTGFTGSAGVAIVLADFAALFVDGRYTVQVQRQVDRSRFALKHLIEEPHLPWLAQQLESGARVACDPRLHSLEWFEQAAAVLRAAGVELIADTDNLIDHCWASRPAPVVRPALLLEERYTGEGSTAKRRRLGAQVEAAGADAALIFAPDSVSWLLNVRGSDVPNLPVLQSWALLHANGDMDLVVERARLPAGFAAHVGSGVRVHGSEQVAQCLASTAGMRVLADAQSGNAWVQRSLREAGAQLIAAADPVLLAKACKNAVEIDGMRAAHRRDGAALVGFLHWLDTQVAAGQLHDEATLAERLLEFRRAQSLFQQPSFDTISAAADNAAMCHYNHRDNPPAVLQTGNLYLVDSGGQYLDGTTDVTRTVAIGEPSDELRSLFTRVLKGHIALDQAVFPHGTTGTHLDILARQHLWRAGLDYDHGTGHGVGHFLNVHEGPQRIARAWNSTALAPGMVISNEPGYYRDHAFGMRCENLVVVVEAMEEDFERPMLCFEALTLAPFDLRLIEPELLERHERRWLNAYHQRVRETLSPLLDAPAAEWLAQATQPLA